MTDREKQLVKNIFGQDVFDKPVEQMKSPQALEIEAKNKEIERLKGLLKETFRQLGQAIYREQGKLSLDERYKLVADDWHNFKQTHNL